MARPSKIHETVTFHDPRPDRVDEELSMTEAFCRYLDAGAYIGHVCGALGLSQQTLSNWRSRGAEWLDQATGLRREDIPESELPYVEFVEQTVRATSRGIIWHEANVRRGADKDPRLSLYFLERRAPKQYSRRVEIDTDPGDREPAPIDTGTAAEVEAAFDAAHVPDGIEPESILPAIGGDE